MTRTAAVACASAALLAGCGGGDSGSSAKSEYEREYREVAERFAEPRPLAPELDTPAGAPGAFNKLRTRYLGFASEVEKLRPPSEVAQAQRDFVAALRGNAKDLEPVVELVRRNDWDAILRFYKRRPDLVSPRTVQLGQRARAEYSEHGYDVDLDRAGRLP